MLVNTLCMLAATLMLAANLTLAETLTSVALGGLQ